MNQNFRSIVPAERCFGCGSCVESCPAGSIRMKTDGEGFSYPEIDFSTCVNCGKCIRVCPAHPGGFHVSDRNTPPRITAVRMRNLDALRKSTSGGVFQALSDVALKQEGMIAGVRFNADFQAEYVLTGTAVGRNELLLSKYVQADGSGIYAKVVRELDAGRMVLFSGTPCQVAGLYAFLGGDRENLYTVDFVCHGVPSPGIFAGYREELERRFGAKIVDFKFRDKEKGWVPMHMTVRFANGKVYSVPHTGDDYFRHFLNGGMSRRCCYGCPFTRPSGRESDITLSDGWRTENLHPGWNDNRGVSGCLVNTPKGEKLLELAEKQLELQPCALADIDQKYLHQPGHRHPDRESFFRAAARNGAGEALASYSGKRPLFRRIKSKIEKYKRQFQKWRERRSTPEHVEIFLFIDALGWKIVNDFNFLRRELPYRFPVRMQFGYSSSAIPTILSGKHPDAHGHLSFYYFDRKHSPFSIFRWFPRKGALGRLLNRGRIRGWLSRIFRFVKGYTGYFQLYQMPFDRLPFFNYCEKKDMFQLRGLAPLKNIHDVLKSSKLRYHISSWKRSDQYNLTEAERKLAGDRTDFYFLYTGSLDGLLHFHVSHPDEIRRKLDFHSGHIRKMLQILQSKGRHFSLTVISDHGMTPLTGTVDLKSKVEALGLRFGTDYAACYDSTMFRVWFLRPEAREKIMEAVNSDHFRGHWLSAEEKKRNGIDFPDHKYGEEIFLLAPGIQIVPSDMSEKPLPGMHGFAPNDEHSIAAILSSAPVTPPNEVADFFRIMVRKIRAMRTGGEE